MIRFACAACGVVIKVDDARAGRRGRCPRCGVDVVVPVAAAGPAGSGDRPAAKKRRLSPLVRPASKKGGHEELIDMTSMVDIVFFLLIFFMVATLAAQQASIEMPVPSAKSDATKTALAQRTVAEFEADEDFVIVRIEADDTIWVEDSEVPSGVDLAARLRDEVQGRGRNKSGARKLLVLANGSAHHGTAVMVLDVGRDVGMEDVRMAVNDDKS